MLLQQIVERLDAELDRLERLRKIIAGLKGSPALVAPFIEVEQAVPPELTTAEVKVQHIPPRLPREGRRKPRAPLGEKSQGALTSSIPARPVVVSPDALAKETAAKKHAPVEPKVFAGTLGAMIRALGQQGAM